MGVMLVPLAGDDAAEEAATRLVVPGRRRVRKVFS
jgi:hypothetical protein